MESFLLILALLLGLKHAYDADHLLAVSNLLTRASGTRRALGLSLWWSLGHMATATFLTILLFYTRETVFPHLVERLELLVPFMLIAIGLIGLLLATRRFHAHRHEHGGHAHRHLHLHLTERHEAGTMGLIGLVHGLASNDELLVLLLVVFGAQTLPLALLLVAVFTLGVVLGMGLYAAVLHRAVAETRRPAAGWVANVAFSLLSIAYAGWLLAGGDGFNLLRIP